MEVQQETLTQKYEAPSTWAVINLRHETTAETHYKRETRLISS
jgi:hypothetical protein